MTESVRLLLVDDEAAIVDMIALVLRKEGFENIEIASTGREAIAKCRAFDPHMIVLDLMLPDMDGFEVCRACRQVLRRPFFC